MIKNALFDKFRHVLVYKYVKVYIGGDMKKFIKVLLTIIIVIIFLQIETYAELDFDKLKKHELYQEGVEGNTLHSTDDFSINIPNDYTQITKNFFCNDEGDNINIQISSYPTNQNPYTLDVLNMLADEMSKGNVSRDALIENFKRQYSSYFSESEIEELVSSFQVNSIAPKEISFCTKNNYRCLHIVMNASMLDYNYIVSQYVIFSKDKSFVLTIGVNEKEKLDSSEIKDILNSFTIFNYEKPAKSEEKEEKESFVSDDVINNMIISAISATIIVIISKIIGYFHGKK